jgi:single-strand DNA-binding protein
MAGTLNKVLLIGNLGKDPETLRFDNGGMIVKFPLATSESYKDREGRTVERTEWHNIVVGKRGLAEVCEKYLRKGQKVYLEGEIRTRKWQDKEGNDRYSTEINVREMTMLSTRDSQTDSGSSAPVASSVQSSPTPENEGPDDLPF